MLFKLNLEKVIQEKMERLERREREEKLGNPKKKKKDSTAKAYRVSSSPFTGADINLDECLEALQRCKILPLPQFKAICQRVKEIVMEEPTVVPLSTPLTVAGDIHGQFHDMEYLLKLGGKIPNTKYLFLGDYVDRGFYSLEVVSLLFCFKARWPDRITLLRGNHESRPVNQVYGFYSECFKKYGEIAAWSSVNGVFDYLPLAATIDNKIYAVHGGLSRHTITIDQVRILDRFGEVPSDGPMADILWSDPGESEGFVQSSRGCGCLWGSDMSLSFCKLNAVSFILRAHQCVMQGYEWTHYNKVATLFSAPNYMYRSGNKAALMILESSQEPRLITFEAVEKPDPVEMEFARPSFIY